MQDLHSLLSWKSEENIARECNVLRAFHQGSIVDGMSRAFAELQQTTEGTRGQAVEIWERIGGLAPDALSRIVDAPETCFQIARSRSNGTPLLADFLSDVVAAEHARQGEPVNVDHAIWSALGDHYFPYGNKPAQMGGGWLEDASAPYSSTIKNSIVIDYLSPYAARPLEQNNFRPDFARPIPYSTPIIDMVTSKIVRAFDGLDEIGGGPIRFVEAMLRTIMPRPEAVAALFSGGSNRVHLGRVNLFNPHLEYINEANIANSLIHEAIHTFLYITEERALPATDAQILYYHMVESPWSGRKIHLLAYIHASFVWYGMYNFWCMPKAQHHFSGTVRDHYIKFTMNGFRDGIMLERLMEFQQYIRPDLFE